MKLDQIKASSFRVKWNLREIWLITQWKDGCVYRTRSLGIVACSPEHADWMRTTIPNIIVGSVSTKVSQALL